MSNLLLTLIAIALVAITVGMATYYGGRTWDGYSSEARAVTLIAEADQILGAMTIYRGMTGTVPALADLHDGSLPTGELLAQVPEGLEGASWHIGSADKDGDGSFETSVVSIGLGAETEPDSLKVCKAANRRMGLAEEPAACGTPAAEGAPCCKCPATPTDAAPYCGGGSGPPDPWVFDLAVDGAGYFQVQLFDGTTAYTPGGVFSRTLDGRILLAGELLEPCIIVPEDAVSVAFAGDGRVTADVPPLGNVTLGNVQLATFMNPAGLTALGGGLYVPSGGSGVPSICDPGLPGCGTVKQVF